MRLPENLDIDIYWAMEEYDENPREFLRKHGYGQAKEYWILAWDDGRPVLYPSKAILGVAMKKATGIRPGMSGGVSSKHTAATILEELGYRIIRVAEGS